MSEITASGARIRWVPLGLILCAGLLLLGQQTLVVPGQSRLSATVHNAMHVPWSMLLTFIMLKVTASWRKTIGVMALIAVGSELMQQLSGRTPSLGDVFSDFLGVSLAVCIYALFVRASRFSVWLPVLGILCISLWTLRPIVMVFSSEDWIYSSGGVLFDGSDPRGFYLADITAESHFNMFSGESLKLIITDAPWSGVHFRMFPGVNDEPEFLRISLTVSGDEPLTLGLAARYWHDEDPVWKDYVVPGGDSELMIPMAEIEADRWLPAIQDLYLYGYQADAGRSFRVHRAEFVWDEG